jgi:hypothetical protein
MDAGPHAARPPALWRANFLNKNGFQRALGKRGQLLKK